jgi:hypothetical protein
MKNGKRDIKEPTLDDQIWHSRSMKNEDLNIQECLNIRFLQ